MILSSKINQLAATDLSNADKLDIRLKLAELRKLEEVIHSTKRRYRIAHKATKLARAPKIAGTKPPCSLCGRPTPHQKGPDGQYHMLAVKRRWMQQASQRRYAIIGYERLWQAGRASRYRTAITRRTAIFKEIAPKSAAKMTATEIEAVINRCRPGKTRWLNNIEKWKTWVRRRYA